MNGGNSFAGGVLEEVTPPPHQGILRSKQKEAQPYTASVTLTATVTLVTAAKPNPSRVKYASHRADYKS